MASYKFDKTSDKGRTIVWKDDVFQDSFDTQAMRISKFSDHVMVGDEDSSVKVPLADVSGATDIDDVVDAIEAASYVGPLSGKYKSYVALLTQSSTDAPTAVIPENTIGTITPGYTSTGVFTLTKTGAFTADKTVILPMKGATATSFVNIVRTSANVLTITTTTEAGVAANGKLTDYPIEVRVYQ